MQSVVGRRRESTQRNHGEILAYACISCSWVIASKLCCLCTGAPANHGVIEVGSYPLGIILSSPTVQARAGFPWTCPANLLISSWRIHDLYGQPVLLFHHPQMEKKCFPVIRYNILCFRLPVLSSVLSLGITEKTLILSFFISSYEVFKHIDNIPPLVFFSPFQKVSSIPVSLHLP